MSKARNTGKFAFEYKQVTGSSGSIRLGIAPTNISSGAPGNGGGAYGYINNARRVTDNNQVDIGSPTVASGQSLLFMVDFDAGTIRIRNSSDASSRVLFSSLTLAELGLRAGFTVTGTGNKIEANVTGPFTTKLDPGYLPWASTVNQPAQLTINTAGSEFYQGDSIQLTGNAQDPEQGDISSGITWSSSRDGALGTGASLSKILSVGSHLITATVLDTFNVATTKTHSLTVQPKVNQEPQVSITAPQDSTEVAVGASVTMSATANDAEEGNLNTAIHWQSDKDGNLGTGASVTTSTLTAGLHVLSASVTDTQGATGIARTTLMVGTPTALATYSYNALGQRASKTNETSNSTTHFLYDTEGHLIAEIDKATGNTLREYVFVNGEQTAIIDNTQTANEKLYFVHNDPLGKQTTKGHPLLVLAGQSPICSLSIK